MSRIEWMRRAAFYGSGVVLLLVLVRGAADGFSGERLVGLLVAVGWYWCCGAAR
jgi:hypothetical protein